MTKRILKIAALALVALAPLHAAAQAADTPDTSRIVIVGDSISAAHQNSCLREDQQPNGYASIFAAQAGAELPLPLIGSPGAPPCLELISLDPLVIQRSATVPGGRIDPTVATQNLSVPGARVIDALDPNPDGAFHAPFLFPFAHMHDLVTEGHPDMKSMVELAVAMEPTTVVLWLGSNDVLWAMIGANPFFITATADFEAAYEEVINRLAKTEATMLVANIPDITVIPFLTPAANLAAAGIPIQLLGLEEGDFVTLPGIAMIGEALAAGETLPGQVVLTAAEAAQLQAAIGTFNGIIAANVARLQDDGYPVALVDVQAALDFVDGNGLVVGGRRLGTGFLAGIFTLDGIHPSNSGHAALANVFIDTFNGAFGANVPLLTVGEVANIVHTDPLVLPFVGHPPLDQPFSFSDVLAGLDFIMDPVAAP